MAAVSPTNNTGLIVDEFIRYATFHLTTISGMANTVSLYPPLSTPAPGIVLWTGYFVSPSIPSIPSIPIPESATSAEAAAVKRDIEVEYPITTQIFDEQIEEDLRPTHNKNLNVDEILRAAKEWADQNPPKPQTNTDNKTNSGAVGKFDDRMYNGPGGKIWPALGEPGNFEISSGPDTNGRIWYKQNPEYVKANCARVIVPLNGTMNNAGGAKNPISETKITIHKDLAAIVEPIFKEIKEKGLNKYIENCGGGLAVRNVTGGTRLSNHAWGTAIDLNSVRYPYGTNWNGDTITTPIGKGKTSTRQMTDFDKGFLEVIQMFRKAGMLWLAKNDPMHISIYET